MWFEQATHDEVIKAVETATEDDGALTEQDRENVDVQNSLRMLNMMYNHETEPGNVEGRSMVLVGVTKAAIEHNQDPQEVTDLIFWEWALSMNEFLGDAFETTEDGNQEINYRLPNGNIMRWVYREEQWIIEWTDLQRMNDENTITFGWRYMQNMNYQFSRVDNFDEAVEAARNRIWWKVEEPLTADVRDTVDVDENPVDGQSIDDLPPSITLDINPDGTVNTLDENGREIELTFDELLARLATTHDKEWALQQVNNLMELHINGWLNSVSEIQPDELLSQALKNIFENENLDFTVDQIIQIFKEFPPYGYSPEDLELSLSESMIREIADKLFLDAVIIRGDLIRWYANDFIKALDYSSCKIMTERLNELRRQYFEAVGKEIESKTRVLLTNEKVEGLMDWGTYRSIEEAVNDTWIALSFFQNNDWAWMLRSWIITVRKEDVV